MSMQSFLAKAGLRLSVLGSSASLAIAAPLANGDMSVAAHTDATRMGMYFDRTAPADPFIGVVAGGVETLRLKKDGVEALTKLSLVASAAGYASLHLDTGVEPTAPDDGDLWFTASGLFIQIGGVALQALTDAPSDDALYARKNATWTALSSGQLGEILLADGFGGVTQQATFSY